MQTSRAKVLALLEAGFRGSITDAAQTTAMPRPTVYKAMRELRESGLAVIVDSIEYGRGGVFMDVWMHPDRGVPIADRALPATVVEKALACRHPLQLWAFGAGIA